MGSAALTLGKAWNVYGRWLEDPRVEFYPEPREVDGVYRRVTSPFGSQKASKAVGDCWLLAYAIAIRASLVTFDQALYEHARKQGQAAVIPG
jgi:predicted nucleic acid-binding protein